MRCFALALVSIAFVYSPGVSLAQTADGCKARMVVVNVRDALGRLVTGLTPDNFRAVSSHKVVNITSVQMETGPRRSIVLLDVSGSMGVSKSKWQAALLVAREIVVQSPTDEQLGLIAFAQEVVSQSAFPATRTDLLERIKQMENRNTVTPPKKAQTSLADVIANAASLLTPARSGDSIWVITDGADNHSQVKLEAVAKQLLAEKIRLFQIITLGRESYDLKYGARDFMDLAKTTGGINLVLRPALGPGDQYDVSAQSESAIKDTVRAMINQHRSFYLLELEMPEPHARIKRWKLNVLGRDHKPLKGAIVLYPTVLETCGSH